MPTSPPKPSIKNGATVTTYFPDASVVDSIKEAAEHLGMPFTAFIRHAAKTRAADVIGERDLVASTTARLARKRRRAA